MNFNLQDIALIPALVGVIQLLNLTGLPKKLSPIISLILGILIGIFYVSPGDLKTGILSGVVLCLSSLGLYSGAKNSIQVINQNNQK
ncbi:hypothetical protein [Tuberibacillus calidus]|jgi:uncharacterized membrane protein YGL010W|uniref:hypothetical protein n=1 Tax=Tuberibacillus calidus TaxID=340097 RepID=UPI0003F7A258|nr:hypothetical protein [Tuberibacillus calidus]